MSRVLLNSLAGLLHISLTLSKIPSDILAFFPNAQEAKRLKGGATNECYSVKVLNETFAFRLGVKDPVKRQGI